MISKLGIDLVVNGHDHDYTRSYLMDGASVASTQAGSHVTAKPGHVLYITTNSSSGGKFYDLTGPYPWAAVTNQAASLTMTPLVDDVQGKTTIGWNLGDWTPAGEDAVITVSYTARVQTNYGGTDPLLVPRPGTLVSASA